MARLLALTFILLALDARALADREVKGLPGWFLSGSAQEKFEVARDTSVRKSGRASAKLWSTVSSPDGSGTLMQRVRADPWRGKRIRFGAAVQAEAVQGWTGLWLRVDRRGGRHGAFTNMQDRPIKGTAGWRRFDLVLDVAPDATYVNYGLLQDGAGASWMDDARLEIVDDTVPTTSADRTPPQLVNSDFESASMEGWVSSGGARNDYEIVLDRGTFHGGRASYAYRPKVDKPGIYGTICQTFNADRYRGKRVRAAVWIRTEGVTARGDFWVRAQVVDSPGDGPGLGGGRQRLEPTSDWKRYEIVFDVDTDADRINFGAGIGGPGRLWADDATFDVVDPNTAPSDKTPTAPVNLDFEQ